MLHDDFNNRLKIDRITARRRFERECSEYRKNNTQTYVEQHQEAIDFNIKVDLASDIVKEGDMV